MWRELASVSVTVERPTMRHAGFERGRVAWNADREPIETAAVCTTQRPSIDSRDVSQSAGNDVCLASDLFTNGRQSVRGPCRSLSPPHHMGLIRCQRQTCSCDRRCRCINLSAESTVSLVTAMLNSLAGAFMCYLAGHQTSRTVLYRHSIDQ